MSSALSRDMISNPNRGKRVACPSFLDLQLLLHAETAEVTIIICEMDVNSLLRAVSLHRSVTYCVVEFLS